MLPLIALAFSAPYLRSPEVLGTPHPVLPQAAAPDGSWVALCQARTDTDGDGAIKVMMGYHGDAHGDARELYVADAAHPEGQRYDRLVDHAGRWLVLVKDRKLVLRDASGGAETVLGPAAAPDARGLHERSASLDDGGTRLLYLEGADGRERVRIRALGDAGGGDRAYDPGPGRVWKGALVGDGSWFAVAVVAEDTDGDGALTLPTLQTTLAGGPCRGEPMSYSTYGWKGDAFEWRHFRTADGTRETREVLAWTGDALVVREADGALTWARATGDTPLAPASCAGEPVAVYDEGPSALVACAPIGDQRPLVLYGPEGVTPLEASVGARVDGWWAARLYPTDDLLIDLATGETAPRAYGGEEGAYGERVLENQKGGVLVLRDLRTGERWELAGPSSKYVYGRPFGRYTAVVHEQVLVIDLVEARVVGTLPGLPVVIRPDGAALVADEPGPVSKGPLRWWTPPGGGPSQDGG